MLFGIQKGGKALQRNLTRASRRKRKNVSSSPRRYLDGNVQMLITCVRSCCMSSSRRLDRTVFGHVHVCRTPSVCKSCASGVQLVHVGCCIVQPQVAHSLPIVLSAAVAHGQPWTNNSNSSSVSPLQTAHISWRVQCSAQEGLYNNCTRPMARNRQPKGLQLK